MDTTPTVNIPDSPKEIRADDAAIVRINVEYEVLKAEGVALREETRRIMANAEKILNHA